MQTALQHDPKTGHRATRALPHGEHHTAAAAQRIEAQHAGRRCSSSARNGASRRGRRCGRRERRRASGAMVGAGCRGGAPDRSGGAGDARAGAVDRVPFRPGRRPCQQPGKRGSTTPTGSPVTFATSFKTPTRSGVDLGGVLRSVHLEGEYQSGHTVSIHAGPSGHSARQRLSPHFEHELHLQSIRSAYGRHPPRSATVGPGEDVRDMIGEVGQQEAGKEWTAKRYTTVRRGVGGRQKPT